jgi:hypothetical protein
MWSLWLGQRICLSERVSAVRAAVFFTRCGSPAGDRLCLYVRYFSTFGSGGVHCNVKSGRHHFDTPGCGGCRGLWSLH